MGEYGIRKHRRSVTREPLLSISCHEERKAENTWSKYSEEVRRRLLLILRIYRVLIRNKAHGMCVSAFEFPHLLDMHVLAVALQGAALWQAHER